MELVNGHALQDGGCLLLVGSGEYVNHFTCYFSAFPEYQDIQKCDFLQSDTVSNLLLCFHHLFGFRSFPAESKVCFCCRYGVLLTQRLNEVSDREQTVSLLNMVGAEEGQYQLGLTKVPGFPFMTLFKLSRLYEHAYICVCAFC